MSKEELKPQIEQYIAQAEASRAQGDIAGVVASYRAAAGLAKQAEWPEKEVETLYNLGLALQDSGELTAAIEALEQALDTATGLNDLNSAGVLTLTLAFACANAGYDEQAIIYFKAVAPYAIENTPFETAFPALSTLGVMLSNANQPTEAIPYYKQALALARKQPDELVSVADTLANLGVAYEKSGQLLEAIAVMQEYHQILFEVGDVSAPSVAVTIKKLKNRAGIK